MVGDVVELERRTCVWTSAPCTLPGFNFAMTYNTKLMGSTVFASLAMLFLSRTRGLRGGYAALFFSVLGGSLGFRFFNSSRRNFECIAPCVSVSRTSTVFDLEALWREEIARLLVVVHEHFQMPSVRDPQVEFTSSRDVMFLAVDFDSCAGSCSSVLQPCYQRVDTKRNISFEHSRFPQAKRT